MLELYQFEECPYSTKVRQKLSEWEIDYIARNVPRDLARRTQLMKVSGQANVPTLVDSDRDAVVAGDDQKILEYLHQFHKPQPKAEEASGWTQASSAQGQTDPGFKGYE